MQAESLSPATMRPGSAVPLAGLVQKIQALWPTLLLAGSRGSAVVAQFAAQLIVGALAGAGGLGVLQLFTSWTCMAGEVLALGLPTRAMREISVAYAESERAVIEQILKESRRKILRAWLLALVLIGLPLGFMLAVGVLESPGILPWLLLASLFTAPLFSLLRLYAESLKAAGGALAAVTIENLASPVIILLACGIIWLSGQAMVAVSLLAAFAVSMVLSPVMVKASLKRRLADVPVLRDSNRSGPRLDSLRHRDLPVLWAGSVLSIGFLQLPFLVLPLYVDTTDIGVFSIAHKLINVITTLLLLLAAVFGPRFARYAQRDDLPALVRLLRRTQLISISVFVPTALVLLLLAEPLAQLFGREFGDLHRFMLILAAGHLVNAATGLSGVLLNMAGAASRELAGLVLSLVLALIGSAIVGPLYGAIGLACVFSAAIAVKNLVSYGLTIHLLNSWGEPS